MTTPVTTGKKRRFLWTIPLFLFLFIAIFLFCADLWYIRTYGRQNFDALIFTLTSNLQGTSPALIWSFVLEAALPAVAATAGLIVLALFLLRSGKRRAWLVSTVACVLSLSLVTYAAVDSQMAGYLFLSHTNSKIYSGYYIDPKDTTITFPTEKRNLVYIVLESMETTYLSEDLGGGMEHNLIPELYQLAKDNINFSQNDGVGGFRQTTGATWTIGALVSQSSGVPLVPVTSPNEKSEDGTFLPGLTTLWDILHEQGYYQAIMFGSDASFGDMDLYFSTHGMDDVYDVYTAREDGIIPPNYWDGWWGMEDYHTFAYAKQKLTEISQKDQPFAFTMMTIDTHQPGGHTCPHCESTYAERYDNVISCSSRQVLAFVQWLQQQDFYEDTAVVIVGDHQSMDAAYFDRNVEKSYTRHIYNCFLNSAVQPTAEKNREFTTVDLFPTILAAMGCQIEGDRLGLGVNLFSKWDTIAEQIDFTVFNNCLYSNKDYYNEHFRKTNASLPQN